MALPKKLELVFYSFLVYGFFEVKSERSELIENITYAVMKLKVTGFCKRLFTVKIYLHWVKAIFFLWSMSLLNIDIILDSLQVMSLSLSLSRLPLTADVIVNTWKGQCSLKINAQKPEGLEGIEVKEHNIPGSVNYFKPWCDTELVDCEN